MLNLRAFSVSASVCGIIYNLLQPIPLWAPACWGFLFIGVNLYKIMVLMREKQQITLSDEQEKAYELAFMGFGFTPRLFLDILENTDARWFTVDKGELIHKRGDSMNELTNLQEGSITKLSSTDDVMPGEMKPGKGGWLGEFFDPNTDYDEYWSKPHNYPISYRCSSDQCKVLAVDRKKLHFQLRDNPTLSEAATKAEVSDLWGKLHTSGREVHFSMYRSMLEVATSDGVVEAKERDLCSHFRRHRGVSDAKHAEFLLELGWSIADFESGTKAQQ